MAGLWKGNRNSCSAACSCRVCTWASDLLWGDVLHAHLFCGSRVYVPAQRRGDAFEIFKEESKETSDAIYSGQRLSVAVFLGQRFAPWQKSHRYSNNLSFRNSLLQKSILYNGIYPGKSSAFRYPKRTALVLDCDVSYVSVV